MLLDNYSILAPDPSLRVTPGWLGDNSLDYSMLTDLKVWGSSQLGSRISLTMSEQLQRVHNLMKEDYLITTTTIISVLFLTGVPLYSVVFIS
jgi:hypothetical protein